MGLCEVMLELPGEGRCVCTWHDMGAGRMVGSISGYMMWRFMEVTRLEACDGDDRCESPSPMTRILPFFFVCTTALFPSVSFSNSEIKFYPSSHRLLSPAVSLTGNLLHRRHLKQGISQIVYEVQKSVGWWHESQIPATING
ncbi:hypothetical protein LWI29_018866 [Acer saccharum]|uniref:Uncharacterized protein n=1 Tax=Acer saccharum TaxID=4024 RepID=A0AA39VVR2_ACESA|nr:hypothetical protein LWI29_018866 [Acer saccharum]